MLKRSEINRTIERAKEVIAKLRRDVAMVAEGVGRIIREQGLGDYIEPHVASWRIVFVSSSSISEFITSRNDRPTNSTATANVMPTTDASAFTGCRSSARTIMRIANDNRSGRHRASTMLRR